MTNKLDDYNDLINDIAKEQAERRAHTAAVPLEEALKSAEKLHKIGIPIESISEGVGLPVERLQQHFAHLVQ